MKKKTKTLIYFVVLFLRNFKAVWKINNIIKIENEDDCEESGR